MGQGSRRRPVPRLLAKKLALIRARLGVGQAEMARLLRKTPAPPDGGTISRLESGEREPNLLVLLEYARIARINAQILIDDGWSVRDVEESIPTNIGSDYR